MGRALRYIEMNRQSGHNPLRTGRTYQSPVAIWGTAFYDGTWNQPKAALASVVAVAPEPAVPAVLDPARELRNAEAAMHEAVRSYDFACKRLGEANRTRTPGLMKLGEVVRQAKSMAFRDLNQSRARMLAARRRLDAARLALGLPLADADAKLAMASVARRA